MKKENVLKPCPFCKNIKVSLIKYVFYFANGEKQEYFYQPRCSKCKAEINRDSMTKNQAIKVWNRRES